MNTHLQGLYGQMLSFVWVGMRSRVAVCSTQSNSPPKMSLPSPGTVNSNISRLRVLCNVIKLPNLEDCPGLSRWAQCKHKGP